jgi:hypothetical protein
MSIACVGDNVIDIYLSSARRPVISWRAVSRRARQQSVGNVHGYCSELAAAAQEIPNTRRQGSVGVMPGHDILEAVRRKHDHVEPGVREFGRARSFSLIMRQSDSDSTRCSAARLE